MDRYVDGATLVVTMNSSTQVFTYGRVHDILGPLFSSASGTVTLPADTTYMVPIFINDMVAWDKLKSVSRGNVSGEMVNIEMVTGSSLKVSPQTNILMFENNNFVMVPITIVNTSKLIPTSLYMPNRVGLQITGGLSISIQMTQSPKDPLSLVSFTSNTWGPITVAYEAVRKFKLATTDTSDIDLINRIESAPVQFNVVSVANRLPVDNTLPAYWLTTVNGSNWMTATGTFIG